MNENTIKHLELIQGVITRLAQNSFVYKGWAITLVAAIYALAAKEGHPKYLLDALLPIVTFWGLDAYYLRQERLYRKLYDAVRKASQSELDRNPFSMDIAQFKDHVATWWKTCWSRSVVWLYGPMALLVLTVSSLALILK